MKNIDRILFLFVLTMNIFLLYTIYLNSNNKCNINNTINNEKVIIKEKYIMENNYIDSIVEMFNCNKEIIIGNKKLNMPYQTTYIHNNWEKEHLNELSKIEPICLVTFGEWLGPIALYWNKHCMDKNKVCDIYAFEPNPLIFSKLSVNTMFYKNIHVYNLCISKLLKQTKITINDESVSKINTGDYNVFCILFKELYSKYNNCLYKIDTEGYEEELIDEILSNTPNEMSISIHEPFIKDINLFKQKLENLKLKYNYVYRVNSSDVLFYELILRNKK